MPAEGPVNPHTETSELVSQLRQSLGLLRVAFDATGEAMLIVDSDRFVRWVNQTAAELWGAGLPLRVIGKPLEALISFRQLDQRLLLLTDSHHPLIQAQSGEGQDLFLIQAVSSLDNSQADVLQRMVAWRPITEMGGAFTLLIFRDLEPMEKSLQQQRAFINTLAHELRTPLAILSGSLRRMDRLTPMALPLDSVLNDAIHETKRMAALVDQLLVLSALDTNGFHWNLKCNPYDQFLLRWMDTLDSNHRSSVCLQWPKEPQQCFLELDQIAVNRIFDCLLDNSLRIGQSDVTFSISICIKSSFIDFNVSDDGPGIPDDQEIGALFDRFSRLEIHRALGSGDGCGLGLSVVKGLVEGMGGSVLSGEMRPGGGASKPFEIILRFPIIRDLPGSNVAQEGVHPEVLEDAQKDPV